jgi:hypothetical protein
VRLRSIVLLSTALLLAAAAAAPWVPAIPFAFAAVCRQIPARSFEWFGRPLPVCARCLGVYAGLLAASIRPPRMPAAAVWVLAGVNGIDWWFGLVSNAPRCALAFAFCWAGAGALLASRKRTASN